MKCWKIKLRAQWFATIRNLVTMIVLAMIADMEHWAHDTHKEIEPISWRTFSTESESPGRVNLPDGSIALLGSSTQARIEFASDRRTVELVRGQAVFKVAHDPQRPFDVLAAGSLVRAVGTEFSVRVRPEYRVDVGVTKGRVRLTSSAQADVTLPFSLNTALLLPGDVAVSDAHGISVAKQGWLTFKGETLAQAVEQVNRFGRARFEVADTRIAQKNIGGPVRILEPDTFVLLLQAHHITSKAVGESPDGLPKFLLRPPSTHQQGDK
jgi:transmembrane sensor